MLAPSDCDGLVMAYIVLAPNDCNAQPYLLAVPCGGLIVLVFGTNDYNAAAHVGGLLAGGTAFQLVAILNNTWPCHRWVYCVGMQVHKHARMCWCVCKSKQAGELGSRGERESVRACVHT